MTHHRDAARRRCDVARRAGPAVGAAAGGWRARASVPWASRSAELVDPAVVLVEAGRLAGWARSRKAGSSSAVTPASPAATMP